MQTEESKAPSTAQEAVEAAKARREELAKRRQELTARRGTLAREVLLKGDEAKRAELQQVIVELNALGAEDEVLDQVTREAQVDWERERDEDTLARLYAGLDEAEGLLTELEELTGLAAKAMTRFLEAQQLAEDIGASVQARLYEVSSNASGRSAEPVKSDQVTGMCLPGSEATRATVLAHARRRIAALRGDLDRGLKGPKAA
ncbi:hypothetical protein GCM10011521_12120 [Arenimonas soli]|uniref:Uncharacterized protein n=1 Tax=Arenimonas soli TaxID=2269504 RepID=A0ABQ1HGY3_9GAMM|nr:hypothetical protein [Arenimonas soli]GGA75541.1 hypothetical protein GCM10011521_12120 [Arenimonas soli]